MKYLLTLVLLYCGTFAIAQETLDLESNIACELFSEKTNFDQNKRLEQIKNLEDQFVTVYMIDVDNNKIMNTYTGKVNLLLIKSEKSSLKKMTSVLVVAEEKENGQTLYNLPLTDAKRFRIYLTECLKK